MGKELRQERKLFAPAVHPGHFRAHGEVIREIAQQHFASWQVGQTVKAIDATKTISLDVIMRLCFGVEDEQVMDEGRAVLDEVSAACHPAIMFFSRLQHASFPLYKKYLDAKANMYDWARRLIALRRSRDEVGEDVLARLMTAENADGQPVSELHICNELISILIAGHVTTGSAVSWVLYELGRRPEILAKLRSELESAGPGLQAQGMIGLPYLSAVCNETIRVHPILSECARVPIEPVEILGQTIPAGRSIVVSIAGIHYDPAIFPQPDQFRPERFIERTFSKTEFMPFGSGHRRCLGGALAEYTMRIATAEAVLGWDFETAGVDRDVRLDLTMGPKFGVPLRILRDRRSESRTNHLFGDQPMEIPGHSGGW
jgi:cytochrome P450